MYGFSSGKAFKISVLITKKAFQTAFKDAEGTLAKANTQAMRDVTELSKVYAREAVRKGGPAFRGKWPNAVRSKTYPIKGASLKPSSVTWVRSDYAGIFETGATISGKPYLWLPLPGVPLRYKGKRTRPGNIAGLISIRRPGKPPLLGLRIKATEARAKGPITASMLSRGTADTFKPKKRRKGGTRIRVIPLFVGISRASITKKWNVVGAVQRAGKQLDRLIAKYLRG